MASEEESIMYLANKVENLLTKMQEARLKWYNTYGAIESQKIVDKLNLYQKELDEMQQQLALAVVRAGQIIKTKKLSETNKKVTMLDEKTVGDLIFKVTFKIINELKNENRDDVIVFDELPEPQQGDAWLMKCGITQNNQKVVYIIDVSINGELIISTDKNGCSQGKTHTKYLIKPLLRNGKPVLIIGV